MSQAKWKIPAGAGFGILFALNTLGVAILGFAIWALIPRFINSDSSAVVLLANELMKSGRWVSPSWFYVSDSLMLDGSVHAAKLGVWLWGGSVAAARFTSAIGAAAAAWSGYWLARVLGAKRVNAMAGALTLLLGPSLIYQDLMLGLPASFQVAWVLVLVACSIRFCQQGRSAWHLVPACAGMLALSLSSPKKAAVYMLLPVACSVAAQLFLNWRKGGKNGNGGRLWSMLAVSIAAFGIGRGLHLLLMQGATVSNTYARLTFVPSIEHMQQNLGTILALAARYAGQSQGTASLVLAGTAMACWAYLAISPAMAFRLREVLGGSRGFAFCYAATGTLVVFAYLLLYKQVRLYYGIYYCMVTLSPLFAIAASTSGEEGGKTRMMVSRAALAVLLILGISTSIRAVIAFPSNYYGISSNQKAIESDRRTAVDWLLANGFRRGFSSYWEANSMTLVSGGGLQVGSIRVIPHRTAIARHGWLSDKERTNHVPGREPWFIATYARRNSRLPQPCLPADRQVVVSAYRIYLYSRPMAGCLSGPVNLRRNPEP